MLFTITEHADGVCVVVGPGGEYVALRSRRIAEAIKRCCDRAYRAGARDAAAQDDTCAGAPTVAAVDELPIALAALTSPRMGLRRSDASELLARVRVAQPDLRVAVDLVRAALLLRTGVAI